MFEVAIKQYWKDKIVILATNQLQYLPYADKVIFLSSGEVVGDGTFQQVVESSPVFAEQMQKYGVGGQKEDEEKAETKDAKPSEHEAGGDEKSTCYLRLASI